MAEGARCSARWRPARVMPKVIIPPSCPGLVDATSSSVCNKTSVIRGCRRALAI